VIHRDLKPANILLNNKGEVKLIDFGLARNMDCSYKRNEQLTPRVTTALYKAPECYLGEKYYTEKVDLWATGLIIYELLTGLPLFPINQGEMGVLFGIFHIFGVPREDTWPGVHSRYPSYPKMVDEFRKSGNKTQARTLRQAIEETRKT
jgi:serine/threonine protein kinase